VADEHLERIIAATENLDEGLLGMLRQLGLMWRYFAEAA
jgi:hypothetical protein